jgi:RNA polymerase sigma-70 factor (ECF subfamily)
VSKSSRGTFADIVLPHLDGAYRLARGLTGNAADAEDVVQDACERALKGLDGFAGGDARAWVLTITRNAAFTFMARKRPGGVLLTSNSDEAQRALEDAPDDAATPEASLIARADAESLERALASLPIPFREIVVLREYNDLSYREIAEMTKLPIGTVMSRLARARSMLLRALTPNPLERTAP